MRIPVACLLGMTLLWHGSTAHAVNRDDAVLNPANGHYYMRLSEPVGWREAKRQCEQLGGHLVTVTSADENRFVFRNFATNHVCWLGATDEAKEGEWRWVTGEPFEFHDWFSDEPNNEGGAENYVALGNTAPIFEGGKRYDYRFGMRWNDHDEPGTYRRQQIVFPVCEWDEAPLERKAAAEDPRDIATHAQAEILQMTDDGGSKLPLHTFCLDAEGNIVAGVGAQPGEIRRFDPDGKYLSTWSVPLLPEAIGMGADGNLFVGGSGQLVRLNAAGTVQVTKDAPHVRSLKENTGKIREQIIAAAAQQKERYAKQVETYEKRIAEIEEKEADEQTERDVRMLASYRRMVDQRRQMVDRNLELSADQIDRRVQMTIDRKRKISSISAAHGDVFLACPATVGYGFDVWRLDEEFENAKRIVTGLSGCCGQMDVQAGPDGLFVAENSRKRVGRYDRDGKLVTHWGKAARKGLVGFGSCCNPMNVAFGPKRTIYTAEATSGRIKRYTPDGQLLGLVGKVDIVPGCKNVAIAVSGDGDRVYMMDKTRTHIVLMKKVSEQAQIAEGKHERVPVRTRSRTRPQAALTSAQQIIKAASAGDARRVKALLRSNPELLNTTQGNQAYGSTPLAFAAYNGKIHVVRVLLDHGASVDFTNNRGFTPLHEAASRGHKEVVSLLLANGADPNSRDLRRQTPVQLAVSGGHHDVARLLRENEDNP